MMSRCAAWFAACVFFAGIGSVDCALAQDGSGYRLLAARCESYGLASTVLFLVNAPDEGEAESISSAVRDTVAIFKCHLAGNNGVVNQAEAERVALKEDQQPTLIFVILSGRIVSSGPVLTSDTKAEENIHWLIRPSNRMKNSAALADMAILSPVSAVFGGAWRCFNVDTSPVIDGIVSRGILTCDYDQSQGAFIHRTVEAIVYSIEDASRFFVSDPSAKRALAAEMAHYVSAWLLN